MDELRYELDLLNAMNKRIQTDERMYRLVCDTSTNAVLYVDIKRGNCKTLGNWNDYFNGVSINHFSDISKIYPFIEDQSVLAVRELLYLETLGKKNDSIVFKTNDGKKYIECRVDVIFNEMNVATDKIIRFIDVTKSKKQNEDLLYMAYYDLLTGLYNRNYFVSQLSDMLRKAEEENAMVSVLFIDLDDFHSINDGLGLVIGDEVVQQVGFLLHEFKSEKVLISHFNADIYCIAIYEPDSKYNANEIYKKLKNELRKPILLSNKSEVSVSFCMGVAEYPEASKDTLELINCAEIVMFKAKKKGKGQIQYFDAPILNDFIKTVTVENKLKNAVFENNFMIYFQPQYYSDSKNLRGVEALIRWRDDDGSMISPALFIPIAEKNGTILPIGDFVIDESIRIYSDWKKKYGISFKLSINISAIQYKSETIVSDVLSVINKYEVDPEDIELEVTESVFIGDFKDIIEKLSLFREYGIKISLDDFGTGYSSLSYLRSLPIDTLKIDKSFVDTIVNDENSRIIIETIIFLSKKLGYETIAEGVETENQYNYIRDIGCNCIQGYYFDKPMPAGDIDNLLMDGIR